MAARPGKHARSVLVGIVGRAAGAGIDRVDRLVEGYDNEVYRVRCADGQDVVVRILRFGGDSTRSAAEAWAIGEARPDLPPRPLVRVVGSAQTD